MGYLKAFVFPPSSLLDSKKPAQAALSVLVESMALFTWKFGVGALLHGLCIMWAMSAAGGAAEEIRMKNFADQIDGRQI